LPIQAYAFQSSPPDDGLTETLRRNQQYYKGNITLVAEEDGVALADASAIPMRQNIRGQLAVAFAAFDARNYAGVPPKPETSPEI
jgi:hypothetical protein